MTTLTTPKTLTFQVTLPVEKGIDLENDLEYSPTYYLYELFVNLHEYKGELPFHLTPFDFSGADEEIDILEMATMTTQGGGVI